MKKTIYVYREYNDDAPKDMITKVSFDKQELLNYMKDRADLFMRSSCKFSCSLEKLQEYIDCELYSEGDATIFDDSIFCNEYGTNYYWEVVKGETVEESAETKCSNNCKEVTTKMRNNLRQLAALAERCSDETFDDDDENGTHGILTLCDRIVDKIDTYLA